VPGKQHVTDRPAPWESGLVIVDKPGGMTSHDVVARIRRLAHTRRVGHAGTLDPMATGVLVIGVEKATRLLGHLMLTEKTYEATIRLGQSTTTDDAEGEPTGAALRPASGVARAALDAEIAKLTGDILQVPSSVSAIKVNGQRAYKLTRAGEAPELAARPVTVYDFNVTATRQVGDYLDVDATIRCSSGTYIRALARDLGAALGTGGHLTALRRTAVGPYTVAAAHTLEDLENQNSSPERLPLTPAAPPPPNPPASQAPAATLGGGRGTVPAAALGGAPDTPSASIAGTSPNSVPGDVPGTPPGSVPEDFPGPSAARGQAAETDRPTAFSPPVIPLSEAAAAAFPRVDLSFDDARRLAQGARLPLPSGHQAAGGARAEGSAQESATSSPAGDPAPGGPTLGDALYDVPLAAFDPNGTLIALVTTEGDRLRSLAVFVDAAAKTRDA
jgi:tRNA pseudouridine55 synthase